MDEKFDGCWGIIIILALFYMMSGGFGGRAGEFGQFASAASQSEILLGQQFQGLDNKIDRIGNGIADATYALSEKVGGVRFDMANYACATKEAIHAEGEATRSLIQQNKIEALQQKISQLELQSAMCGVVRYPMANVYTSGSGPFCGCNNGCGC